MSGYMKKKKLYVKTITVEFLHSFALHLESNGDKLVRLQKSWKYINGGIMYIIHQKHLEFRSG